MTHWPCHSNSVTSTHALLLNKCRIIRVHSNKDHSYINVRWCSLAASRKSQPKYLYSYAQCNNFISLCVRKMNMSYPLLMMMTEEHIAYSADKYDECSESLTASVWPCEAHVRFALLTSSMPVIESALAVYSMTKPIRQCEILLLCYECDIDYSLRWHSRVNSFIVENIYKTQTCI